MNLEGKKIGFVISSSYDFERIVDELKKIVNLNAKVIPIISKNSYTTDINSEETEEFIKQLKEITGEKILHTIQEVENLCTKDMLDIIVVAPASGNIISKLSNDIIDDIATVTIQYHLVKQKPVVIGISTNRGLSSAGENIGKILNRKFFYFVPFKQENPITKPYSPVFTKIGFYSF